MLLRVAGGGLQKIYQTWPPDGPDTPIFPHHTVQFEAAHLLSVEGKLALFAGYEQRRIVTEGYFAVRRGNSAMLLKNQVL